MFDPVDIEQPDRIGKIRQSSQSGSGDEEGLQTRGQFRQLLELLAFANAERLESGRELADAPQGSTAVEAELLETFRKTIYFDNAGIVEIYLLDTGRQVRQRLEPGAVIEHQALQAFGKAFRQLGQGGVTVEIDHLDTVRQRDADIEEVRTAPHSEGFHGRRNGGQPRQPALLIEAEGVGLHREMMSKRLVGFQIFCPRPLLLRFMNRLFLTQTHTRVKQHALPGVHV